MNTSTVPIITAADLMTRPILTVFTSDSLGHTARLFTQKKIGAAVVIAENNKPVGVITKTDLVRYGTNVWGRRRVPVVNSPETVLDWMTPSILAVPVTATACDIARRMTRYHMHHMFIWEGKPENIVGIISSLDLLRAYAAECGDSAASNEAAS